MLKRKIEKAIMKIDIDDAWFHTSFYGRLLQPVIYEKQARIYRKYHNRKHRD